MHCKHNHRVGTTRAAWLSLPALFARAWDSASGVTAPLKTPVAASLTDRDELLVHSGSGARLKSKSCLTPFTLRITIGEENA